ARLAATARALRLGPSDDYELLLAVDPERRRAFGLRNLDQRTPLAFIGTLTDVPGARVLETPDGEMPIAARGFDHLAAKRRAQR
ncbi:MAG: thiamine-phosphate kinase, partial [Candidatus Eisenbacteria bacterium]|nr:thiamine-phosphate kinase [Candidatus Eisenbacteria bacterium]